MEQKSTVREDKIALIETKLPVIFLQRLRNLLSNEAYEASLLSFDKPKPLTFRANTLRATASEVLAEVSKAGLETSSVEWCPNCHLVEKGTIRDLQELSSWEKGELYIQAASSMLSAYALQVEPEMRVLDMCAAPGSKTTLLAAMMENTGMLVANDRSRKRLYRLREILQRQGATNVEVLQGPGERLGQSHADCFDRVLVDAPCSGEGRFRIDRPIRLSRWSLQEIQSLSKLQEQLLIAALRCVCVGGLVVYSTCTFAPEENEVVLEKVLSRKGIDAEIIPIPDQLLPQTIMDPISTWNGDAFESAIQHAIRIIPNSTTTGFFIACLKRCS